MDSRLPGRLRLSHISWRTCVADLLADHKTAQPAGPRLACQRHDGSLLAVTAHALPPAVELLDAALNAELFQQPLQYYEHTLGTRYPDDNTMSRSSHNMGQGSHSVLPAC